MSDIEKADFRAQGAFDNFLVEMERTLEREGRSPEYKAQFWRSLNEQMRGSMAS
jgi:hypothetical protein